MKDFSLKKPVYVLGVGLSHNGSACLLKDGHIVVAIEKERLTKKKNDGGNDTQTIAYCLKSAGISGRDLSLIVQNANFGSFAFGNHWYCGPRILPPEVQVVTISHHLAHAYSAYFLSRFQEAAILIVDGCGNAFEDCTDLAGAILPEDPRGDMAALWFEKDSYYMAADTSIHSVYKDFSLWGRIKCQYPMHPPTTRHSIGGIYAGASAYSFTRDVDLGKLMGLAPYGRSGIFNHQIFDVREDRVYVNYDWIEEFVNPALSDTDFANRFQYFADIAWLVQREVERALIALAKARYKIQPSRNLCFGGGVALNAVANQRIVRETPFRNVFVPPAADDSGLAIGCAYYGWHALLNRERRFHNGSPFLGHEYNVCKIEEAISGLDSKMVTVSRPTNMSGAMTNLLADGKVIAWFRGGSEIGPRALGHRSILGDPRRSELRDYINREVKYREDFRPFAPAVLAEDAGEYFDLLGESRYMLFVVSVHEKWRNKIGAVVHVDGSARVQTVAKEDDPCFHALLQTFKNLTGIGMLLNTSLNRRGEPIVETPSESVDMLLNTGLHGLVLGPYMIEKRNCVKDLYVG